MICTGLLNVVVVNVELRIWVRGASSLKCNADVARAERVEEHVLAPSTVVVERLVDDVPRVLRKYVSINVHILVADSEGTCTHRLGP